jgi:hypothetical protein
MSESTPTLVVFGCSLAGSLTHDSLQAWTDYEAGKYQIPSRYRTIPFYVLRFLLAISAGLVAVIICSYWPQLQFPAPITSTIIGAFPAVGLKRIARIVLRHFAETEEHAPKLTASNSAPVPITDVPDDLNPIQKVPPGTAPTATGADSASDKRKQA